MTYIGTSCTPLVLTRKCIDYAKNRHTKTGVKKLVSRKICHFCHFCACTKTTSFSSNLCVKFVPRPFEKLQKDILTQELRYCVY